MHCIIRTTRASATHLATAQRHAGAAARAESEADRVLNGMGRDGCRSPVAIAAAARHARNLKEEADRRDRPAKQAMAKHEKARALLG